MTQTALETVALVALGLSAGRTLADIVIGIMNSYKEKTDDNKPS